MEALAEERPRNPTQLLHTGCEISQGMSSVCSPVKWDSGWGAVKTQTVVRLEPNGHQMAALGGPGSCQLPNPLPAPEGHAEFL